jgi:hypothetical protein
MVRDGGKNTHVAISTDVKAQAGTQTVDPVAGKTVAEILGEIVWLMTQDPAGREMKVAEIEALVMPAILAKRFHIMYAQVLDKRRPGATALQPVQVKIFESAVVSSPLNHGSTILAEFSLNRGLRSTDRENA